MPYVTICVVTCVMLVVMCQLMTALSEEEWIHVSRCRAKCLSELVPQPVSDSTCKNNRNCSLCVKLCERQTLPGWDSLCSPSSEHICPSGCQVACDYTSGVKNNTYSTPVQKAVFPARPITKEISDERLLVGWKPVKPIGLPIVQSGVIIYSLFWRDADHADWGHVCSTSLLAAQVNGPHRTFPSLQLKLVAVTEHGVLDVAYPRYPPQTIQGHDGLQDDYEYEYYYDEDDTNNPARNFVDSSTASNDHDNAKQSDEDSSQGPNLDRLLLIGIEIRLLAFWNKPLVANISWSQPTGQSLNVYVVHVVLVECNDGTDGSRGKCGTLNTAVTYQVQPLLNKSLSVVTMVTYNSEYSVTIETEGRNSPSLHFTTPHCPMPSPNLTECLIQPDLNNRLMSMELGLVSGSLPTAKLVSHTYIMLAVSAVILLIMVAVVIAVSLRSRKLQSTLRVLLGTAHKRRDSFCNSLQHSFRRISSRSHGSYALKDGEGIAYKPKSQFRRELESLTPITIPFLLDEPCNVTILGNPADTSGPMVTTEPPDDVTLSPCTSGLTTSITSDTSSY